MITAAYEEGKLVDYRQIPGVKSNMRNPGIKPYLYPEIGPREDVKKSGEEFKIVRAVSSLNSRVPG